VPQLVAVEKLASAPILSERDLIGKMARPASHQLPKGMRSLLGIFAGV
jgi:hypothetical protein